MVPADSVAKTERKRRVKPSTWTEVERQFRRVGKVAAAECSAAEKLEQAQTIIELQKKLSEILQIELPETTLDDEL